MNAPRDTAIAPQEQDTNRSGQSSRQPLAEPYNAPEVELLSVGDGESEHDGEHDSENDREWPCICGDGLNTDGTWIRCDQSNCPFTWYHLACVGLKNAPPGKWVCPQCQARPQKISKKEPSPKKRGTAVKVPQKKEQVRWKGWRELPSDEEEQFKQNVESSWAAQMLPRKTRSGPRQDAPGSEDESESIGNGQSSSQKLRMDILRQSTTDPSLQSGSSDNDQTAWMSELIDGPEDMMTDDEASSSAEDDTESTDRETVMDVDDRAASAGKDEAESTDRDTVMEVDDRDASPGEDECGSTDWETVEDGDDRAESPDEDGSESESTDGDTVMDGDDRAESPDEDGSESESTNGDTVMEVEDIANFIIETARETDHVSDDPTGSSSGMTAAEAASVQVSDTSATTGERIEHESTAGEQALVAALKRNWVGQYFA